MAVCGDAPALGPQPTFLKPHQPAALHPATRILLPSCHAGLAESLFHFAAAGTGSGPTGHMSRRWTTGLATARLWPASLPAQVHHPYNSRFKTGQENVPLPGLAPCCKPAAAHRDNAARPAAPHCQVQTLPARAWPPRCCCTPSASSQTIRCVCAGGRRGAQVAEGQRLPTLPLLHSA